VFPKLLECLELETRYRLVALGHRSPY
jgi:hypothetical protein